MNPLSQVWHVLAKDARQQRRILVVYLLLVVVATAHALGWRPLANGVFGGAMVVIGLVILLLVASVIQGDSPTRSDAFWASHPLDPYAVLAAKILFALALVAVAVIGQEIAIRGFDPTGDERWRMVVHPALSLITVMLAASVIASLTRDVRTFMLVTIVMPVLMVVTIALVSAYTESPEWLGRGSSIVEVTRWVTLALAAALLPWLYRTRDARWQTRVAGYLIAGIAVATLLAGDVARRRSFREPGTSTTTVPRVPLSLELATSRANDNPGQLSLALVVAPMPEQLQLALNAPTATLHFRDGSVTQLPLGYGYQLLGGDPLMVRPSIPGVRWLREGWPRGTSRISLTERLTPAQREALDAGGGTVVMDATIGVDTIVAGKPQPLVVGGVMKADGQRATVEDWSHPGGRPDLVLHSATIGPDDSPFGFERSRQYALINRTRGEAFPLAHLEARQSADGLVLPLTTLLTSSIHLGVSERSAADDALPADDWYRDAELLPVSRRTLGSYPVRLTLVIAPR